MKKTVATLKTYFETGDVPTQQQFWDFLDSFMHLDTGVVITNVSSGVGGYTVTMSDASSFLLPLFEMPVSMPISYINGLQAFIDAVNTFQTNLVLTENNFTNQNLQDLTDLMTFMTDFVSSGGAGLVHIAGEETITGEKTFNETANLNGGIRVDWTNGTLTFAEDGFDNRGLAFLTNGDGSAIPANESAFLTLGADLIEEGLIHSQPANTFYAKKVITPNGIIKLESQHQSDTIIRNAIIQAAYNELLLQNSRSDNGNTSFLRVLNDKIGFKTNNSTGEAFILTNELAADRIFYLPNAAGRLALESYVDGLVTGLLDDRGSYNASTNLFPTTGGSGVGGAIMKGDLWYVGTAGTLGGQAVNIGDNFRALVDTPAQTASNWSILQSNVAYVPANDANTVHKTGNEVIAGEKEFLNLIYRTYSGSVVGGGFLLGGGVGSYHRFNFESHDPTGGGGDEFGSVQIAANPEEGIIFITADSVGTRNAFLNLLNGNAVLSAMYLGNNAFVDIKPDTEEVRISGTNNKVAKLKTSLITGEKEFEFPDTDGTLVVKSYVDNATGWEAIIDTAHTVGAPQTVAQGVTANLTNNKGTVFNTQLPTGVTTFFDSATSKITPQNENDFMTTSFMFKAKNSNIDGHFTIYIDIPSLGERFTSVHKFPKGLGVEHGFDIDISHFVSSQFAANGGIVKIVADSGDLEIYDKQFRFCRVHRAN